MADHLLVRVSGLVAACTRRVSRATRRLLRHHHHKTKQPTTTTTTTVRVEGDKKAAGGDDQAAAAAGVALWSRRILMGERCQPLDFAGAIHYDSFGRRLARPPTYTPRSAATSLSCGSSSDSVSVFDEISYISAGE